MIAKRALTGGGNLAATDSRHGPAMRRTALIAAALALCATDAAASEKKEGKGDVGQYVDLQPVGLPIVSKGQLVNYVFVYVRINLTSGANVAHLREKEPYFRDALVRAGHRTPFTLPTDLSKIDAPRLTATLARDAAAIAGPGQIRSIVVTSQAPRRRMTVSPV
jgi:hypothetical protein